MTLKKGIKTILNLGDSLYGPLDPIGTYDLLIENNIISISGNQDRFIIENLKKKSKFKTLEYVKSQLNNDIINWLRSLKFELNCYNEIYCCHASPNSDSTYLLESLKPDNVSIKTNSEIDSLLKTIKQRIIVCGHSHVSKLIETETKTILNPGSIGLPAYEDDAPIYHKMENYNHRTSYSILRKVDHNYISEQVSIPYDFDKAAILAEKNNRKDWAK